MLWMPVLHALAALYAFLAFQSEQPTVAPAHVAVALGYCALMLAAELVRARPAAPCLPSPVLRGFPALIHARAPGALAPLIHAVAGAAALRLAAFVPEAVLLVPFSAAELVRTTLGTASRFLPAALYAAALALVAVFLAPARTPAFALWAVGVYAIRATTARLRLRVATLERELTEAEHAVAAENRSRELAATLARSSETAARLEERRRIAVAVHDQLGHTVTGSLMQLEAARLDLRDDPDAAEGSLLRAEDALRRGMDAIRTSLKAIKPAHDEIGLGAIERAVYEFEQGSRFSASLDVQGDAAAIPASIWTVMLANLNEAFTNCAKHSTGSRVSVEIAVLNRVTTFGVRDDGRVPAGRVRQGMGLQGIEERTARTGGQVIVDASRGFMLKCVWRRDGNAD